MSVPPAVLAAREQGEVLFSQAEVVRAIDRLAVRLEVALAEENPLLVCVLNGGLPLTAALMQRLSFPLQMTYVHVGRYSDTTQGGELTWHAAPPVDIRDRHVLLVDDILDRGVTLALLRNWALEAPARAVSTVVLLDKTVSPARGIEADYAALTCPDRYVFGWGMDYQGYWRNLPDILALPAGPD